MHASCSSETIDYRRHSSEHIDSRSRDAKAAENVVTSVSLSVTARTQLARILTEPPTQLCILYTIPRSLVNVIEKDREVARNKKQVPRVMTSRRQVPQIPLYKVLDTCLPFPNLGYQDSGYFQRVWAVLVRCRANANTQTWLSSTSISGAIGIAICGGFPHLGN